MGDKTKVDWADASWNPTTGCDRVSPGCLNCYALTMAARLKAMGQPAYQNDGDPRTSGPGFALTVHWDRLDQPNRWTRPRRIFVNSMSDLFHPDVPDHFVSEVFDHARRDRERPMTARVTYRPATEFFAEAAEIEVELRGNRTVTVSAEGPDPSDVIPRPARVSWPSIGQVSAADAAVFGSAIIYAAGVADRLSGPIGTSS